MQKLSPYLIQARALLADIEAATETYIPRREILKDWLRGFVDRIQSANYDLGETEAEDLTALDHFLRGMMVPVAGHAVV